MCGSPSMHPPCHPATSAVATHSPPARLLHAMPAAPDKAAQQASAPTPNHKPAASASRSSARDGCATKRRTAPRMASQKTARCPPGPGSNGVPLTHPIPSHAPDKVAIAAKHHMLNMRGAMRQFGISAGITWTRAACHHGWPCAKGCRQPRQRLPGRLPTSAPGPGR